MTRFALWDAADKLAAYIGQDPEKISRKQVMELVHQLNAAYIDWAAEVDNAEVVRVD